MYTFSEENITRIRNLSCKLRWKHNAMEWGVGPLELIEREGVYYEEYDLNKEGFFNKLTKGIKKIAEIIRAALIFKENVVLIDENLHNAKKPFGQGHELGHNTIPEHKEILYVCSEMDLNMQTRKEMEYEANIFSSETLFPSPLMKNIYKEYPLCFETILQLRTLSGASIHASAIRYVKTNNRECCLLILKPEKNSDGRDELRLTSQLWSSQWHNIYKQRIIVDNQIFPANHALSQIAFSVLENNIAKTSVTLREREIKFQAHTFFNGYLVFALIF